MADNNNWGGARQGAGRKKSFSALAAEKTREYIAKRVLEENEPIVSKAIDQAKAGDKSAREWLYDRGFDKVRQNVGLDGGEEGSPIVFLPFEIADKNNIELEKEPQ